MIKQLIKSKGLMQSLMLAVGNVGASGFSAISLIILSRYLGPERFGSFSVAFSLSQLVARFADLGLNVSLQKYTAQNYLNNITQAAAAVRLTGFIKLGIGLSTAVIGLIIGNFIGSDVFNLSDPSLAVLGISLAACIILYEYVIVVLQSIGKFGQSVLMNAAQAMTKCVLAVLSLIFLSPNTLISYLWYGMAPLAAVVYGWYRIPKTLLKSDLKLNTVSKTLFDTAKFSSIAVFAAAIGDNIDVLMVKSWLDEYQTGLYAAAVRVAMVLTLFGISFGAVFNTRVARYRDQYHLSKFLTKALVFSIASLLLIPIVMLFSKTLIMISAGSQFMDAISSMNILMAAALVTMASMPFVAVFYAVNYPAYFAIAGVIQTVVLVAANYWLIPRFGIEGAAIAKLVTRTVVAIYSLVAAFIYAKRQFLVRATPLNEVWKTI